MFLAFATNADTFFVAEYTLLFRGNPKIIIEMLHTYLKYIRSNMSFITGFNENVAYTDSEAIYVQKWI